jgi:hypothetical protein
MKKATVLQPALSQLIVKKNKQNKPPSCGYGKCSSSGCYCQAYQGNSSTCENCGHNYGSHW